MKRLLGLLLALALLPALPVLVAPSASAACPYTPCEAPRVMLTVASPVAQGTRAVIGVRVRSFAGSAEPEGTVVVEVKRSDGGFSWTRTYIVSDSTKTLRSPRLTKKGKYRVTATFVPKPDTTWRAASAAKTFRVERKR